MSAPFLEQIEGKIGPLVAFEVVESVKKVDDKRVHY